MANIIDYVEKYGKYALSHMPFGEVDNLVLSELAALRWEKLMRPGEALTLRALQARVGGEPVSRGMTAEDDARLLPAAAASERFGMAILCEYEHEFDEAASMQFAAVTLLLPDDTAFVAFRGTDGTIVGWKEDFNMAFTAPVPSQHRAEGYLRRIAEKYARPLRVGGHSKGGNLALYAAATTTEAVQRQLLAVYTNDGPGMSEEVFASDGFARIVPKLFSFVPQSSLFGMLLDHTETYAVVYSDSVSVFQHNPYTWQVADGVFVKEKELRKGSQYVEQVLHRWLAGLSDQQRKDLVDSLFRIVESTKSKSFGLAVLQGAIRDPAAVRDALKGIDKETRLSLTAAMMKLVTAAINYTPGTLQSPSKPADTPAEPSSAPTSLS